MSPATEAVRRRLTAQLPRLAASTREEIFTRLRSYQQVDEAAVEESVGRNLEQALRALQVGRAPAAGELDRAASTVTERFTAGASIEDVILAYRFSLDRIHQAYVDNALELGVPVRDVIAGSRILWEVGDTFTSRAVTTYQALQVEAALADASRRASVVRDLLHGRRPEDPAAYGLDPDREYAVVRCRVPVGANGERLRAHLERTGSGEGAPALVVLDDNECLGLVTRRPTVPDGVVAGLGPFTAVSALPGSDRTARLAQQLGEQLGRAGVQDVLSLGWRVAAAARGDVVQAYRARFLEPVRAQGAFGEDILVAVRAWLRHGRSIPRAALAVPVHVNTLRYRLGRFTALTGCDLEDPDDLVGVLWAVELADITLDADDDAL